MMSCEFITTRSFPWGHELHLISGLSAPTSSYVLVHWSPAQPQFCLCLSPLDRQRVTSQLDLGMESSLGTCPVITGLATLSRCNPSLSPILIHIDFPDWPWTCLSIANFPYDSSPWLNLTTIFKPALFDLLGCWETGHWLVRPCPVCFVITLAPFPLGAAGSWQLVQAFLRPVPNTMESGPRLCRTLPLWLLLRTKPGLWYPHAANIIPIPRLLSKVFPQAYQPSKACQGQLREPPVPSSSLPFWPRPQPELSYLILNLWCHVPFLVASPCPVSGSPETPHWQPQQWNHSTARPFWTQISQAWGDTLLGGEVTSKVLNTLIVLNSPGASIIALPLAHGPHWCCRSTSVQLQPRCA